MKMNLRQRDFPFQIPAEEFPDFLGVPGWYVHVPFGMGNERQFPLPIGNCGSRFEIPGRLLVRYNGIFFAVGDEHIPGVFFELGIGVHFSGR